MRAARHTGRSVPRRTPARRRRLRWALPLAAAGVVGALVASQAPVGTPAALAHPEAATVPSGSAGTGAADLARSSTPTPDRSASRTSTTERVVLERRTGSVRGDGTTTYVANGTTFRPGSGVEVALPPRVRARSWVVVDLDSGRVLGRHQARRRLPQASTIKVLSALTAVETVAPRTAHKITRFEARQVCACAGVLRGRRYRRDVLMAGMLLPSGNDAAEAVAGSHPSGRFAFYRAMNRVARDLGAVDTVARNASGLTAAGSWSTARDLVIFLRAAVQDDTIAGILAQPSARIVTADGTRAHTVWRRTDYVNRYENSLGKSGWTTPAQNTLVVATRIRGRHIAVASLGAPSGYSTKGARALTVWAARNFAGLESVGRLPAA